MGCPHPPLLLEVFTARTEGWDNDALKEWRFFPIGWLNSGQRRAPCAGNDTSRVHAIAQGNPELVNEVITEGGTLLAEFAGVGNDAGVRHLLDLGVDAGAVYTQGDGYFGVARNSTALHVAAWRARHATARLLIERGAPLNVLDGDGRTPLALAIRACVDSYWSDRRSPESVKALLDAGASVDGVDFPSGYSDVDELLRSHGK